MESLVFPRSLLELLLANAEVATSGVCLNSDWSIKGRSPVWLDQLEDDIERFDWPYPKLYPRYRTPNNFAGELSWDSRPCRLQDAILAFRSKSASDPDTGRLDYVGS
jgi:hypothetical protein